MIQPTKHMELKKKENKNVDASILHIMGNKIITGCREKEGPGRKKGGGGKGGRIRYWKGQERSIQGQEIEQKYEAEGMENWW